MTTTFIATLWLLLAATAAFSTTTTTRQRGYASKAPLLYIRFEGRLRRLNVLRALLGGALGALSKNPSKTQGEFHVEGVEF